MKVLLVGETWVSHATHYKGFDSFSSTTFHNGATKFLSAMQERGIGIQQIAAHDAPAMMPRTAEQLAEVSVVILSDIGANSLVLTNETWLEGKQQPNALVALRDWVKGGGGLMMVGGYLTFQGIQGLGNYARSPVEEVLPIRFLPGDDRCETPEGAVGTIVDPGHPITAEISGPTPVLLGHNRSILRDEGRLLMSIQEDPLLACRSVGDGRSLVWSSDIGPHWCPDEFMDSDAYGVLLSRSIQWLAGEL